MGNFEFLKEPFLQWYKNKEEYISSRKKLDIQQNAKDIISYDDIDIDKIDDALLYILENPIPPDVMKLILHRFVYLYEKDSAFNTQPNFCEVSFNINNLPNALNWLLVNIKDLNFFDITELNIQMPYKQCHYCGRPYSFIHKNGDKFFNKKIKYCHCFDCESLKVTTGSNPLIHLNCCFGKYAQSKKILYQKLKVAKTSKEDKIQTFIKYCENKLQENKKIKWTIQTKEKDAIYEDDWWDENIISLSSFHYEEEKLKSILYHIDNPLNWKKFSNFIIEKPYLNSPKNII